MNTIFLDGYINLNAVDRGRAVGKEIKLYNRDKREIYRMELDTFSQTLIGAVPPVGDWEVLGGYASPAPVLAWGLDVLGRLKPIAPGDMEGVNGDWAIRKVGSPLVYAHGTVFFDEDDWLNYRMKKARTAPTTR